MAKLIKDSKDAFQVLELIFKDQDKDGLWEYIHDNFGIAIPRKAVCPHHDAPFDFVADVFFQKVQNAIALANRTGGKQRWEQLKSRPRNVTDIFKTSLIILQYLMKG